MIRHELTGMGFRYADGDEAFYDIEETTDRERACLQWLAMFYEPESGYDQDTEIVLKIGKVKD